MNEHMRYWQAVARPPASALKTIKGGRLSGMTDVNPQWRYQAMTEQFGPCGVGWKYTIDKLWTEDGCEGEVLAFAQVSLQTRIPNEGWSQPVVGIGGNHMVVKESKGLRNNDECWKMAVTDALSVAMKMLGVAADIYAGRWDGSKYADEPQQDDTPKAPAGFDDWLIDLETTAGEGTSALQAMWKTSAPNLRKHLTYTDAKRWEELKEKAAKVRERVSA